MDVGLVGGGCMLAGLFTLSSCDTGLVELFLSGTSTGTATKPPGLEGSG